MDGDYLTTDPFAARRFIEQRRKETEAMRQQLKREADDRQRRFFNQLMGLYKEPFKLRYTAPAAADGYLSFLIYVRLNYGHILRERQLAEVQLVKDKPHMIRWRKSQGTVMEWTAPKSIGEGLAELAEYCATEWLKLENEER